MNIPLYQILPAPWCKKLSLSEQKKHDQEWQQYYKHLQDPLKDLISQLTPQTIGGFGGSIEHPSQMDYQSIFNSQFNQIDQLPIEFGESTDGQQILKNDYFKFSSQLLVVDENLEVNELFSQEPYEVDVGKGVSLPQMPATDDDVDLLPPYQYLECSILLEKDTTSIVYYDHQMGAFKIGTQWYINDI